jgi:hypothetical protein
MLKKVADHLRVLLWGIKPRWAKYAVACGRHKILLRKHEGKRPPGRLSEMRGINGF